MTAPLELAQSYLAQGWPVFPCRAKPEPALDRETGEPLFDPNTGEVEMLKEKTPYTWNGFKSATIYPHIIERWWRDHPDAMPGLPTGERIGAWVLDIDVKNGIDGYAVLAALEAKHGALPDTARVLTASGGTHYYFKHVDGVRNRGAFEPGIDVRGDGGYVIAPGASLASGKTYAWIASPDDAPIAMAPQWLLDLVVRQAPAASTGSYSGGSTANHAYVDAAVDKELSSLASVPMGGGRNIELNKSSFCLGTFVGAGALPETEARALLQGVARSWGRDWNLCCKTIENGLEAGKRQPREIPEQGTDDTSLKNVQRLIENSIRRVREDAEPVQAEAPEPEPDGPIHATPFKWMDPTTIPRREYAFGQHYIRKYVSVTVSPGGLGKTSNSIVEALAMASGRDLTGTKPENRMRVWLFNAEDPRDEMERRIMAACLHFNLKPEDINGYLFLDSGREQELVIAKEDKRSGVTLQIPIIEAIVGQIERNKIDVLIIDPFISTHGVNENDNGAIDKVAKLWAQIADYTNCSIDVVHHLRKVADREATVEDARGAVSLIGAARSVRVLNRMSDEQATAAGLNPMDRFGYFSIAYGKSNLAPMSHKLDWRKLEGVGLGNGTGLTKQQDFAPVVTSWHWPSSESIADGLTSDQMKLLCVSLDSSNYKAAHNAKPWAGEAVAYALGLDADDPGQRKRAAQVLKALLKEGRLVEARERDPINRKESVFVRSREAA